jgi:hypothetical protein
MGSPDAYGKSTSQNETRIFAAKGLTLKLMYGVSGIASILDAGAEVLQAIYRPTIEELAAQPFSNLGNYADAVMLKLRPVLCDEIQKIKPLPESRIDPDHPYSFKIQFAGYCNGSPVMTDRGLTLWSDKWCVTTSEPLCTACPWRIDTVGVKRPDPRSAQQPRTQTPDDLIGTLLKVYRRPQRSRVFGKSRSHWCLI